MALGPLHFHDIRDINDDNILPWLDLYETSFPPEERVLVSTILEALKNKAGAGQDSALQLIALMDADNNMLGMAAYQLLEEHSAAYLWYIAVKEEFRGKGLGARIYREITKRVCSAGVRIMVFEVEMPDLAHSDQDRQLAVRRIDFYRRMGAKLMGGIDYIQYVGSHQPGTPMHVMVHLFEEIPETEVFQMARLTLGESLTKTNGITLE